MIEKTIYNYLKKELSVPVFTEHQENEPSSFVLFEKTSGDLKDKLNRCTFAFQSYGTSILEVAELNEEVKEKVLNMVVLDEIGSVNLNSDYNFTDTTTKRYRYQAVFDIVF